MLQDHKHEDSQIFPQFHNIVQEKETMLSISGSRWIVHRILPRFFKWSHILNKPIGKSSLNHETGGVETIGRLSETM